MLLYFLVAVEREKNKKIYIYIYLYFTCSLQRDAKNLAICFARCGILFVDLVLQ